MSAPRYRLLALHGFLGSPADWEPLPRLAAPTRRGTAIDVWELFGSAERARLALGRRGASTPRAPRVDCAETPLPAFLVGYSFGARLALAVARPRTPRLGNRRRVPRVVPPRPCGRQTTAARAARTRVGRAVGAAVPRRARGADLEGVGRAAGLRRDVRAVAARTGLPAPRVTLARAHAGARWRRSPTAARAARVASSRCCG